jgi:hypothetical protein
MEVIFVLAIIVTIICAFTFIKSKDNRALIISIAAFLLSSFALYDRIFPPTVKVIDLIPVISQAKNTQLKLPEDWPVPDNQGIYLLARVISGGREVSISAIEFKGKLFLGGMDWFMLHKNIGRTFDETEDERKNSKPYFKVLWTAYPTFTTEPINIPAHQDRLILFTLKEPSIQGEREEGFSGGMDNYVGYLNTNKEPQMVNKVPWLYHFVEYDAENNRVHISGIRADFKNGNIDCYLKIADKEIRINSIRPLRLWRKDIQEIVLEKFYYQQDEFNK